MGSRCTRDCRFCAVEHEPPAPPDPGEPARVAAAAQRMGLRYVVVTSVTRDDLPDGGAGIFAETVRAIRSRFPGAFIEVLIPDFQGDREALRTVVTARPDVLNHNLETVPRLYPSVRTGAESVRSLELLRKAKRYAPSLPTKSGLMLGLGESPEETHQTLQDLLDTGCSMLTLGQYLQPSKAHLEVVRYVPPEEFDRWREVAMAIGLCPSCERPLRAQFLPRRGSLSDDAGRTRPIRPTTSKGCKRTPSTNGPPFTRKKSRWVKVPFSGPHGISRVGTSEVSAMRCDKLPRKKAWTRSFPVVPRTVMVEFSSRPSRKISDAVCPATRCGSASIPAFRRISQ